MEGVSLCVAARLSLQFRRTADKGIQSENLLYSCINHLQGALTPLDTWAMPCRGRITNFLETVINRRVQSHTRAIRRTCAPSAKGSVVSRSVMIKAEH